MKTRRIYPLILFLLYFTSGPESYGRILTDETKPGEPQKQELFTEKKTKFDDAALWETGSKKTMSENISYDDDSKLYAPPPGEDGNPQKIVVPLGNSDVAALLLMSLFMAAYYSKKRHNKLTSKQVNE
ncbi:MAG: hypothetical protein FWF54_05865 [Candidatus Azobacteroides sp.]|nr:hypothetical protein [Candidatus Azobacteroides sp.]